MFRYLAVFIIFFMLSATPVYASSWVALVIGNANYQKISRLNNTINDADDMEQALCELGFEVIKVTDGTKRLLNMVFALSSPTPYLYSYPFKQ